jgi:acetyl esterase/lipase
LIDKLMRPLVLACTAVLCHPGASAASAPVCGLPGIDLPAPVTADNRAETSGTSDGTTFLRNVTQPTLTPVPPLAAKANGAAVIVAPGGGFLGLAIDKEGCEIAHRLAERGIASFVLKYRTLPTPVSEEQFSSELARLLRGESVSFALPDDTPPAAAADGLAALRYVRGHAARFGIDPRRVGFMGFSAGGFLTRTMVAQGGADVPVFAAPIYPNMAPLAVPANAPPMFVAIGQNDFLLKKGGLGLVDSYLAAGKPIDFHLFGEDEHGFGAGVAGKTSSGWLDAMVRWLDTRGLLSAAAAK